MTGYDSHGIPVFAGPSLADWNAVAPFEKHPPAAALDLLRLAAGPACTVVLIDGLFDASRSVWHKEVLLLLARGFRVIGAASMGALRAAELAPYGMIGVGSIFQAFVSGRITADDEVAVIHAPAEFGATPLSVAQIDVRANLAGARRVRAIEAEAARRLRALSAGIHYRDRTWGEVIARGETAGLRLGGLAPWLALNGFSQKSRDAHAALDLALRLAVLAPVSRAEPPMTAALRRALKHVALGRIPAGEEFS
jgi:hypothetical protein